MGRNKVCDTDQYLLALTTQSGLLATLMKKPFKNIVGKEEIAGNQQFLLFPQCFLPYQRQKSTF